jgi:hypothetical protein
VVIAASQAVVLATPAPNSTVPELMVMVLAANTAPIEATNRVPLPISKSLLRLLFVSLEVMSCPFLVSWREDKTNLTMLDEKSKNYLSR